MVVKKIFLVRIRRFFVTSEATDASCLVNSNFCTKKIVFIDRKRTFTIILFMQKFEQEIWCE